MYYTTIARNFREWINLARSSGTREHSNELLNKLMNYQLLKKNMLRAVRLFVSEIKFHFHSDL